jgi:hypothetical protein
MFAALWPAEIFLSASGPMMSGVHVPGGPITPMACSSPSTGGEILAGTPSIFCNTPTELTASSGEVQGHSLMPRVVVL